MTETIAIAAMTTPAAAGMARHRVENRSATADKPAPASRSSGPTSHSDTRPLSGSRRTRRRGDARDDRQDHHGGLVAGTACQPPRAGTISSDSSAPHAATTGKSSCSKEEQREAQGVVENARGPHQRVEACRRRRESARPEHQHVFARARRDRELRESGGDDGAGRPACAPLRPDSFGAGRPSSSRYQEDQADRGARQAPPASTIRTANAPARAARATRGRGVQQLAPCPDQQQDAEDVGRVLLCLAPEPGERGAGGEQQQHRPGDPRVSKRSARRQNTNSAAIDASHGTTRKPKLVCAGRVVAIFWSARNPAGATCRYASGSVTSRDEIAHDHRVRDGEFVQPHRALGCELDRADDDPEREAGEDDRVAHRPAQYGVWRGGAGDDPVRRVKKQDLTPSPRRSLSVGCA